MPAYDMGVWSEGTSCKLVAYMALLTDPLMRLYVGAMYNDTSEISTAVHSAPPIIYYP